MADKDEITLEKNNCSIRWWFPLWNI
jgi:hypothetical protein